MLTVCGKFLTHRAPVRSNIFPLITTRRFTRRPMCSAVQQFDHQIPHKQKQWGQFDCLEFLPDDSEPRCGLVLLSDVFGLRTDATKKQAQYFASKGFVCLVPDLFTGHPWPSDTPITPREFEEWRNQYGVPYERIVDIADACRDFLAGQKSVQSVGLVGYCYGGGRITETLANDLEGGYKTGVSFYGTRIDPRSFENVSVPVLLIFAELDKLVPQDLVAEIKESVEKGAGGRVEVFRGVGHAFVHAPKDVEIANRALQMSIEWLNKCM